jgi:spoIIIJ-associated protein
MASVETEGDSIDAAIEAALKALGTTRDRVEIEILTNSSRGIFGIGGRKARVRAAVRAPITASVADRSAPRVSVPEPATAPPTVTGEPVPPPAQPSSQVSTDDGTGERAAQLLEEIVRHIGIDARVVVRHEADHILLELTGDSTGMLIGRRGQMLDALEYLINRIVGRDDGMPRLLVDSENYRARRRAALEEMARRMGEQAKRKGKPVTLNPMSPHDRRIVHLILQEDPALTTKSAGTGYLRRLVIVPEGATAQRARRPRPPAAKTPPA